MMSVTAKLRSRVKAARKRGALWVRILDVARLLPTAERQARLWTRLAHARAIHQTSADTAEDRYPALFDRAANLMPDAKRILSFGCSTGEELAALRRRFPNAEIVGAEINPRSRRIAARRTSSDALIRLVPPGAIGDAFDLMFALAVFQREPHKIAEMEVEDLSPFYPFERFDAAVGDLVERLNAGGLLCVANAMYRVEDSSAATALDPLDDSPTMDGLLFAPDGRRLEAASARTFFRKRGGRRGGGPRVGQRASRAR